MIKHNSEKKKILTKRYFSVYQRANLAFDILLEPFGANLAKIFKFKKEKLLTKMAENAVSIFFENDCRLAILDVYIQVL